VPNGDELQQKQQRFQLLQKKRRFAELTEKRHAAQFSNLGYGSATIDAVAEGLTLGYDTELIAKGRQIYEDMSSVLTGRQADPGVYERSKQELGQRREYLGEQYPWTTGIGEVAGFIGPGKKAQVLVKGGKALLTSAKAAEKVDKLGKALKTAEKLGKAQAAAKVSRGKALATVAGTLAAESAVIGGAMRPEGEDIVDIPGRLKTAAVSGAFGAGIPVVGRAAGALWRGVKKVPRKVLSSLSGVDEVSLVAFAKNPERYLNAADRVQVKEQVDQVITSIHENVKNKKIGYEEAKITLKELGMAIKAGKTEKHDYVKQQLKMAQERLAGEFMQAEAALAAKPAPLRLQPDIDDSIQELKRRVSEGSRKAFEGLRDQPVTVNKIDKALRRKVKELGGRGSAAAQQAQVVIQRYKDLIRSKATMVGDEMNISASEIKRIIQDIDTDVSSWNAAAGSFDDAFNKSLKELRGNLSSRLKDQFPTYKIQMERVAEDAGLLSKVSKEFGDESRALSRLSNIAKPIAKPQREMLAKLGAKTGKDFTSPIEEYIQTQRTLKSRIRKEDIRKGLRPYAEVQKIKAQEALIKRQRKPKVLQEQLRASKQFEATQKAMRGYVKADELKKRFTGWTTTSSEGRIKAIMGGQIEVRKRLKELGKMSSKDFEKMVDDLRVKEAFDKDITRGSKNVNLWQMLGYGLTGGAFGGAPGVIFGGLFGAAVDKYGPKMAQKILIATSKIKKRPTVKALRSAGLPPDIAEELVRDFQRAIAVKAGTEE